MFDGVTDHNAFIVTIQMGFATFLKLVYSNAQGVIIDSRYFRGQYLKEAPYRWNTGSGHYLSSASQQAPQPFQQEDMLFNKGQPGE